MFTLDDLQKKELEFSRNVILFRDRRVGDSCITSPLGPSSPHECIYLISHLVLPFFSTLTMSGITLARFYRRSFEAYPHCTLAIAGSALTALGDVVAQLSQQIVRFPSSVFDNVQSCLLDYTRR